jgi:hypothetical protein
MYLLYIRVFGEDTREKWLSLLERKYGFVVIDLYLRMSADCVIESTDPCLPKETILLMIKERGLNEQEIFDYMLEKGLLIDVSRTVTTKEGAVTEKRYVTKIVSNSIEHMLKISRINSTNAKSKSREKQNEELINKS